jgi:hypothetical protein
MQLFRMALIPVGLVVLTVWPLMWTVLRILRPVDQAAKERNLPFRFSLGDFLCLFWVVQIPLAFVFQIEGEETEAFYWIVTVIVWAVAPLVWITCARALSKAGISAGKHRFIFLGVVVPTVYYGLFPFIGLSWAGVVALGTNGLAPLMQHRTAMFFWGVLVISLIACGFYSPWLVRHASANATQSDD